MRVRDLGLGLRPWLYSVAWRRAWNFPAEAVAPHVNDVAAVEVNAWPCKFIGQREVGRYPWVG